MQNPRRKWELAAAAVFVVVHLLSPLWIGELYPFTISPMFCGSPTQCCRYEVRDADDQLLDPAEFNLHMVYDGNPPGLGMGIEPSPTLHPFGEIGEEDEVVAHVREILKKRVGQKDDDKDNDKDETKEDLDRVVVHQHCYFPEENKIQHQENVWTVELMGNAE